MGYSLQKCCKKRPSEDGRVARKQLECQLHFNIKKEGDRLPLIHDCDLAFYFLFEPPNTLL